MCQKIINYILVIIFGLSIGFVTQKLLIQKDLSYIYEMSNEDLMTLTSIQNKKCYLETLKEKKEQMLCNSTNVPLDVKFRSVRSIEYNLLKEKNNLDDNDFKYITKFDYYLISSSDFLDSFIEKNLKQDKLYSIFFGLFVLSFLNFRFFLKKIIIISVVLILAKLNKGLDYYYINDSILPYFGNKIFSDYTFQVLYLNIAFVYFVLSFSIRFTRFISSWLNNNKKQLTKYNHKKQIFVFVFIFYIGVNISHHINNTYFLNYDVYASAIYYTDNKSEPHKVQGIFSNKPNNDVFEKNLFAGISFTDEEIYKVEFPISGNIIEYYHLEDITSINVENKNQFSCYILLLLMSVIIYQMLIVLEDFINEERILRHLIIKYNKLINRDFIRYEIEVQEFNHLFKKDVDQNKIFEKIENYKKTDEKSLNIFYRKIIYLKYIMKIIEEEFEKMKGINFKFNNKDSFDSFQIFKFKIIEKLIEKRDLLILEMNISYESDIKKGKESIKYQLLNYIESENSMIYDANNNPNPMSLYDFIQDVKINEKNIKDLLYNTKNTNKILSSLIKNKKDVISFLSIDDSEIIKSITINLIPFIDLYFDKSEVETIINKYGLSLDLNKKDELKNYFKENSVFFDDSFYDNILKTNNTNNKNCKHV